MANGTSQIQLPPGYEDATPVAGPLATQSQSQVNSGVSLPPGYEDAKPVTGPLAQQTTAASQTTPSLVSRSIAGVEQGVQEFTAPVTPQDHKEALVNFIGGPGALSMYKAGKAVVSAVENIVKPNQTQTPTQTAYQTAVDDFHKTLQHVSNRDYRNAASSAGSTAGDLLTTMPGPGQFFGPQVRDVSEGLRPGADLATPLAKDLTKDVLLGASTLGAAAPESAATAPAEAETAGTAAKIPEDADFNSPSKPTLAQQVASETAAPATPVEVATAKAVSKSKLPTGSPASVVPTGENIQPTVQQGIRDFINKTHADNGLPSVPDQTSVLDVPQQSADAFQARSQSTFKQVEAITKVNPTTLRDIMSARADQIESFLAAGKDEEAGNLQQLQLNDENRMARAFNDAKAKGVDVEQARSDWNKSLRADELSSAVRGSKSSTSTLANPEIDPSKLTPRLQKLYESQPGGKTAKLAQLGGDDNATNLVETAENARAATTEIKDFEPTSATGQKAMQDILRPNTGSRLIGSGMKTNFLKSLDDFEKLSPAEQAERFPGTGEVEQARSYLKSQARWQVGKRIAAGVGITAIAASLGVTGVVIRALME